MVPRALAINARIAGRAGPPPVTGVVAARLVFFESRFVEPLAVNHGSVVELPGLHAQPDASVEVLGAARDDAGKAREGIADVLSQCDHACLLFAVLPVPWPSPSAVPCASYATRQAQRTSAGSGIALPVRGTR